VRSFVRRVALDKCAKALQAVAADLRERPIELDGGLGVERDEP